MNSFIGQFNLPLAVRQNNAGNLRPSNKYKWLGELPSENGYCVFDFMEHGIRAMAIDLKNKIGKDGLNEIQLYVPKFAPPSDGNFTESYINVVSTDSGFAPDQKLTPDEPTILKLIPAHIKVEVGSKYAPLITLEMITTGVSMAFN